MKKKSPHPIPLPIPLPQKKIVDLINMDMMNIVILDLIQLDSLLQDILKKVCHNEFQIMFSALICRIHNLVISFPLAFTTFKQKVGPASVDWVDTDMTPVMENISVSNPIVKNKYLNLKKILISVFSNIEGIDINDLKFELILSNSIHRHPSNFGFSSRDLSKNIDDCGVVYRKKDTFGEEILQMDGILYFNNQTPELNTLETRLFNISNNVGSSMIVPTICIYGEEMGYQIPSWTQMKFENLKYSCSLLNKNYISDLGIFKLLFQNLKYEYFTNINLSDFEINHINHFPHLYPDVDIDYKNNIW